MKNSPRLIKDYGSFQIANANVIIRVWEDDNILQYRVDSVEGHSLIHPQDSGASVFHRWSLYWGEDGRLWVDSSDIGLFVWERTDDGAYRQVETNYPMSDALIRAIPEELYANMAKSTRRRWDRIRNPSTGATTDLPDGMEEGNSEE